MTQQEKIERMEFIFGGYQTTAKHDRHLVVNRVERFGLAGIAPYLFEAYEALKAAGRDVARGELRRDLSACFHDLAVFAGIALNEVLKAQDLVDFSAINKECLDLAERKGHDYAGDTTALSNFMDFGAFGVVVRLSDKAHRFKNFMAQGVLKVEDEKIADTLRDIYNYCALGTIVWHEERVQCPQWGPL